MSAAAALRRCRVPLVLCALLAATARAGDAQPPLTDEDVVRMLAAGRPESEIVRTIGAREARFDLSEEMLAELRLARVPERILEAMRVRQAQLAPAPAPAKPTPAAPQELTIVHVAFAPARSSDAALWIPTTATDAMAKALQLGPSPSARRIDGLALFIACTTADHVPDQWRMRSPLGRDFVSMPRHELLALQAGAIRVPAKDVPRSVRGSGRNLEPGSDGEWLRLDLPVELSVGLRPGAAHDLVVGLAVLVGENYLAVAQGERREVLPESLTGALHASVGRQAHSDALEVKLAPP